MTDLKTQSVDEKLIMAIGKMREHAQVKKTSAPPFVRGKDGNGELRPAVPGSEEAGYKRIDGLLTKL